MNENFLRRQVFYSAGANDSGCYAPTVQSTKVVTSGSVTQPYGINEIGHQGLLHDEQMGLIYNWARYLNPMLGRFMQNDPLGNLDSENMYQYERSLPITRIDPKGIISWDDDISLYTFELSYNVKFEFPANYSEKEKNTLKNLVVYQVTKYWNTQSAKIYALWGDGLFCPCVQPPFLTPLACIDFKHINISHNE